MHVRGHARQRRLRDVGGEAHDGGPGADTGRCRLGTDCTDCGPRCYQPFRAFDWRLLVDEALRRRSAHSDRDHRSDRRRRRRRAAALAPMARGSRRRGPSHSTRRAGAAGPLGARPLPRKQRGPHRVRRARASALRRGGLLCGAVGRARARGAGDLRRVGAPGRVLVVFFNFVSTRYTRRRRGGDGRRPLPEDAAAYAVGEQGKGRRGSSRGRLHRPLRPRRRAGHRPRPRRAGRASRATTCARRINRTPAARTSRNSRPWT